MTEHLTTPAGRTMTAPDRLTAGTTVVIADTHDPPEEALPLAFPATAGTSEDAAVAVTTTESATTTLDTYHDLTGSTPHLSVLDTTSARQSVTAPYGEHPVVFTPAPGDLERLILGLTELTTTHPNATRRHLIVRSLTPMVDAVGLDRLDDLLDRVTGFRSPDGLTILGLQYTAHDDETLRTVAEDADAVLWVERTADSVTFDYQPTHALRVPQRGGRRE